MTPNLTAPAAPKQVDLLRLASDLLTMAAVGCASFGVWRMGVDFGWTGDFVIQNGFLSHWQVWIGATVGLFYLNRRLDAARSVADGD
jgi:hypothetical protein